MLTRKHSIEGKNPFGKAAELFNSLDADAAMKLAMVAGDITLVLDETGLIVDTAFDPKEFPGFEGWEGTNWIDTVTVESRPKVMEMLAAARRGEVQHWRQVNHPTRESDVPIRYAVLTVNGGEHLIAFGRDLRETGRMQQRLLQVQQSLERDYLRMRQMDARYRMLFENSGEPMLLVEAGTLKIREANSKAYSILGARTGSLAGKRLPAFVDKSSRDALQSLVGAALASDAASPAEITLSRGSRKVAAYATGFIQDRAQQLLVRFAGLEVGESAVRSPVDELLEEMPDGFVVADANLDIVSANAAFIEMVQAASLDPIHGRNLSNWIGRPGIDLELIEGQVDQHGCARNVSTVLRAGDNLEGLTPKGKMGLQIIVAALATGLLLYGGFSTEFYVPFLKTPLFDLAYAAIPFWVLVFLATTNAVNLTDGLDGLAIGPVLIISVVFALIAYIVGNLIFSEYLKIIYVLSLHNFL